MTTRYYPNTRGPFRAEQIRDKDPYELSNGHAIHCLPGGREHANGNFTGATVLGTDPDVEWAGVDAGYTTEPGTLRAPDVAIGTAGPETGWIKGTPALAMEYAGVGKDEAELRAKIADLLQAGTKYIWVVRLTGPRRVEVYEPGQPMRRVLPGEMLTAPGVLRNPVKVEALYNQEVANEATLRNLLQRHGYESIDAIAAKGEVKGKSEGRSEGKSEGKAEEAITLLSRLIIRRFGKLPKWAQARIDKADIAQLEAWAEGIFDAKDVKELLGG